MKRPPSTDRPAPVQRAISTLHLAILLDNLHRGAVSPNVGFEDAGQTLQQLTHKLDRHFNVYLSDLESALWSCNLMNENGAFWHPLDRTFDEFLRDVLPGEKFDKNYNFVKEK